MNTGHTILNEIDKAFGSVPRPQRFTVEDGDPECMHHDKLLHSRTPDTLTIDDVGNGCSPLSECLPDGMAYFFPTLARLALNDRRESHWFPFQLAWHLTYDGIENDFLNYCSDSQRSAVHALFCHINESRSERTVDECWYEEITECIRIWSASSDA